ncbi:MAG: hypothetical protein ACE5IL_08930 [Myxococcota bacterium]
MADLAPILGLTVAFGGPALLVSPAHRLLGDPDRLTTRVLDQVARSQNSSVASQS